MLKSNIGPRQAAKKTRLESARKWIELAIVTGHDPRMIQQPSGRWGLEQRAPRFSGQSISEEELPPLPRELWDELFEVCKSLGRVISFKEAASC
jgi:hypothetical protein